MKRYILLIALSIFSLNAIHAEITWTLSDDGTLTISGTDMPNYNFYVNYAPWYSQREAIKKVVIKDGVTSIGNYAFQYCSGLTSITIPESVKSIGQSAFQDCKALTSITIPNSVTSIGNSAFYGCKALTSITIPNSVTSIEENAFGCSGLTSITIPNSVTFIDHETFVDCSGLTSITIPNSVTSIGLGAFSLCSGLTSITIPSSVIYIEDFAFYGCSGLTSITIPSSVIYIEDYAFSDCSGLTSVTIPNSVTSIEKRAFYGCSGLTSVTCEATIPPTCGSDCFYNVNIPIPVYVPANSVDAYKKANGWKDFTNIQEIPDNQKIADAVVAMINAIDKVEYTDACKDKINAANNAYNALTADQKALVTNFDVLTKAQQIYETLKAAAEKLAADKAKADPVIAKINAIGKVEYTYACKDKIDEANNAYNALTDDQKALVTNLDVLTKAQQTYETLKAAAEKLAADKTKADAVIAKITAIGKVEYTDACKDKIDEANNAYNALTADQKALVTNVFVLTTAKQTYDNLRAAAEKLKADKAAFDKYKSEIIAIIEALVKDDDSDAVKDIIRKAISNIDALEYDAVITLDDNKAKIQSFVTSIDEAVENQRAEDQKTNGIEELEFADKYNIYDLNGRKITNSMLKSGLYIRNGKEMVVK